MILLAGSDEGLLEGLAQVLCRCASVVTTPALDDTGAHEWREAAPSLVVIERTALSAGTAHLASLIDRGIPLVAYHTAGATAPAQVPPRIARFVVADLELPLERHRLVAIAERLLDRARTSGREHAPGAGTQPSVE